ncbi:MAG: hypothetical protein COU07_00435 [Candidatus Harrisonbacteria bacterium CG10_big_fil_rev_8_21_14_0_10_40_38]|uniref:Glycosyltransferase 2-like domain-containing protein n=1 Tax=Candidatus Harrisonbacteria bacterium CG10_big_fil_rev_8_21_14_0_10_40_38 TaxID=1974583 RepID=A0A2H0USJ6_9BACT|nr:MAG: hypothetical protein COU07_00435 [Candidatus Harrisonbacteria bacterium CG10_big_fil_rev_8_21_14_0_10_40_38]
MSKPFISVIIPAKGDFENLPLSLLDINYFLEKKFEEPHEIMVIDSGLEDECRTTMSKFEEKMKNFKLLTNSVNEGTGRSIKMGMLTSSGSWKAILGGDEGEKINSLSYMIPFMKPSPRADILIGTTPLKNVVKEAPHYLPIKFLQIAYNFFIKILFRARIEDSWSDVRCFSENSAEKIFSMLKFDSNIYGLESLVLADRMGLRIRYVDIPLDKESAMFSLKNYLQMITGAIRMRWWLFRKKYALN